MTWNYRVIEFREKGQQYRAVHEVFYDDDGKPESYGAEAAQIIIDCNSEGDPEKRILIELGRMIQATARPMLKPSDFSWADRADITPTPPLNREGGKEEM